VAVNYASRKFPLRYVAIKQTMLENDQAKLCRTTEESTGLESVAAVGMGMMLMKMAIVPSLPDPKDGPRFISRFEDGNHIGEDVHFCKMIRDAGFEILIDHDLSKEISHIGQLAYKLQQVWAMEEEGFKVDYELRGTTDGGGELGESERSDEHNPDADNAGREEVREGQAVS